MRDFIKRNWFFGLSFVILLVTVFYVFVVGVGNDIYIFGYKPFVVASGSMEPAMRTHAFAVIKKTDYDQASVGDIAAFRIDESGQVASHRIVEIDESGLVTKGDSNAVVDFGHVTSENYIGKVVFYSNSFAGAYNAVTAPGGFWKYVVAPIAGIVAIVFLIKFAIKNLRKDEPSKTSKTSGKPSKKRRKTPGKTASKTPAKR